MTISKEEFTKNLLRVMEEKKKAKQKRADIIYRDYVSDIYRDRRSLRRKMGHKNFSDV